MTSVPDAEVGAFDPSALPVFLAKPEEWETSLSVDWTTAGKLQRPLPEVSLKILARNRK